MVDLVTQPWVKHLNISLQIVRLVCGWQVIASALCSTHSCRCPFLRYSAALIHPISPHANQADGINSSCFEKVFVDDTCMRGARLKSRQVPGDLGLAPGELANPR